MSAFCRLFVYLFALWAGLAGPVSFAPAEPVFPTGLRVGLEPPGDLKLSNRFPGFEDSERQVAIAILDLPASAYLELETAVFNRPPADLENLKREAFPFENGIGFLISGTSRKNGVPVHRWSFLARTVGSAVPNLTTLINVEVPDSALSVYSDPVIRKALASVTFRPAPIQEQLGLLPFKLKDLSGFQVMQVSPVGSVILSDGPSSEKTPHPFMVVSIERGGPAEIDRSLFARDLMANAPVRDLAVQSAEPMRIKGAPGHEIRALGKAPQGDQVAVVQWLRFSPGSFLRVIGVSPADKWDQSFARFRAVRDGIDFR